MFHFWLVLSKYNVNCEWDSCMVARRRGTRPGLAGLMNVWRDCWPGSLGHWKKVDMRRPIRRTSMGNSARSSFRAAALISSSVLIKRPKVTALVRTCRLVLHQSSICYTLHNLGSIGLKWCILNLTKLFLYKQWVLLMLSSRNKRLYPWERLVRISVKVDSGFPERMLFLDRITTHEKHTDPLAMRHKPQISNKRE